MKTWIVIAGLIWILAGPLAGAERKDKKKKSHPTPLDRYVTEAMARAATAPAPTPGSLWLPGSRLADAARDMRASQVDDILTILVAENASATASGTTKTARASSAKNSVTALAGAKAATSALANLAQTSGNTQLAGQGTTTRGAVLSATLTAHVTSVLPNGGLVVEGVKDIQVNSEWQTITVRGVARPTDVTPDNVVRSDHLAQLDVRVNGKGVVGDAIRRPFILYRLLMGLLPF
jgi:flagellar L-ring protein precursor FlgH